MFFRQAKKQIETTSSESENVIMGGADMFDTAITVVRVVDHTLENNGIPDILSGYRDVAAGAGAGAATIATLGCAAKVVQSIDQAELQSAHYFLYRLSRELDKTVETLQDRYNALTNEDILQTYQQFFAELGFDEDASVLADAESEFHDTQAYLYHSAVNRPRRLFRRAAYALGRKKSKSKKSYAELKNPASIQRYERYVESVGEAREDGAVQEKMGLLGIIKKDVPLQPQPQLAIHLNTWEKWFSRLFMYKDRSENQAEEKGLGWKIYNKIKMSVSDTWDTIDRYTILFWVSWATVWIFAGTAVLATTLASGLTLLIPAVPAAIFLLTKLFKTKETAEEKAEKEAKTESRNIFFAKAYLQMLRFSHEKLHEKRLASLNIINNRLKNKGKGKDKQDVKKNGDKKTRASDLVAAPALDLNLVETTLNEKHATYKEVVKRLLSLNIISAISLAARLVWSSNKQSIRYQSPTERVLDRLDSQFNKNRNKGLSLITGFMGGSLLTSFAAWPATSLLVFIGISAAGGPLAQLICYGIAVGVGVFTAGKNVTQTNIKAKKHQAILEQCREDMNALVIAEKELEYRKTLLKRNYKEILSLANQGRISSREAAQFKPLLPITDLVTQDRFYRRKTSETSKWTTAKKIANRAYHYIYNIESGMLFARTVFYLGGIIASLQELGLIGSLGTTLPITMLVSFGFMYGGIKLNEYCVKKQLKRDIAVAKNARSRLNIVNQANTLLAQQLVDQQYYLEVLQQQDISLKPRRVNSSVALIRSKLSQEADLQPSASKEETLDDTLLAPTQASDKPTAVPSSLTLHSNEEVSNEDATSSNTQPLSLAVY